MANLDDVYGKFDPFNENLGPVIANLGSLYKISFCFFHKQIALLCVLKPANCYFSFNCPLYKPKWKRMVMIDDDYNNADNDYGDEWWWWY